MTPEPGSSDPALAEERIEEIRWRAESVRQDAARMVMLVTREMADRAETTLALITAYSAQQREIEELRGKLADTERAHMQKVEACTRWREEADRLLLKCGDLGAQLAALQPHGPQSAGEDAGEGGEV